MTQKHFTAVAEIIRTEREEALAEQARGTRTARTAAHAVGKLHENTLIAHRLANYFATQNPNFKRNKFLSACGVTS